MKALKLVFLLFVIGGVLSMKAYATIGQEPYTGFDNVLIPEPPLPFEAIKGEKQPWLLNREQFAFSAVAKAHIKTSDNWGMELDSDVFLSHEPEDRNTTPKLRAAAWIRQVGSIRSRNKPTGHFGHDPDRRIRGGLDRPTHGRR